MIEHTPQRPRDIERKDLQDRLATVDHDTAKLQDFLKELYTNYPENPQIFYMASVQLVAMSYLDYRIDRSPKGDPPEIPNPQDALAAFHAYTRLISELKKELDAPGPQNDRETLAYLLGAREEIVHNATLAYATAHGADFVALPTPASLDFNGGRKSNDMQIFFPLSNKEQINTQIKLSSNTNREIANYDSQIPILSLGTILGKEKTVELRGLLRSIGDRDDPIADLPQNEHEIIMDAAGAIVAAAHQWVEADQSKKSAA